MRLSSRSRWVLGASALALVVGVWVAVTLTTPRIAARVVSETPRTTSAPPTPGAPTTVLEADFGEEIGRTLGEGSTIPVTREGGVRVDAHVIARGDGRVMTVAGPAGRGAALQFPSLGSESVAVVVQPSSPTDLTPGTAKFTYGADFMADGDWDDGDNVVQRGLYTDRGQYKLEIDGGRPACSIKGSTGQVTARSGHVVTPHAWYTAQCVREGDTVTVIVRRLGATKVWSRTVEGKTGDVRPESPTTQLSIGAKTWDNGRVGADPDQFNGTIDNVYVRIW